MKIWLLRHGEAEPSRGEDAQRQLTADGRQQVEQAASWLVDQPFDAVLCSPYPRAQQTAEVLFARLGRQPEIITAPWLTPDESVAQALRQLEEYPLENLLLIGHQPLLGLLGGWLCEGHRQASLALGTASLACVEGDCLGAGTLRLRSLQHASV